MTQNELLDPKIQTGYYKLSSQLTALCLCKDILEEWPIICIILI